MAVLRYENSLRLLKNISTLGEKINCVFPSGHVKFYLLFIIRLCLTRTGDY